MKNAKPGKEGIKELSRIMKTAACIELHVRNFDSVRKFYKGIGFEIILDLPGDYLVVRKGLALLSFWGDGGRYSKQPYFRKFHDSKKGLDVEIVIPVKNIKRYYNDIKGRANVVEGLRDRRWGAKDFRIEDPNGFYIRFTEPFDWVFGFKGYSADED